MTDEVIDYRFSLRRGNAATWASVNDVLLVGEIGLEKDTGLFKIGDGVTAWNSLPYHVSGVVAGMDAIEDGQTIVWNDTAKQWEAGAAGKVYQAGTGMTIDNPSSATPTLNAAPISVIGRVDEYTDLPVAGVTAGDAYMNDGDGLIYVWSGFDWNAEGEGFGAGGGAIKSEVLSGGAFFDDENITGNVTSTPYEQVFADVFGSFSGTGKWAGGVLAPNGKIYCVPYNSTTILVIDPATNTTSTFGSLSGTNMWYGGVLAPNGKIYCVPYNSTTILVIDPATNTTSTFGSLSGTNMWIGGVLAPNGKIYCVPYNSTTILVIDPATNTTSTFGSFSGTGTWAGGVLAPNGKIYCVPYNSTTILVIDPATNTTSTFGSLSGTGKWIGGVLAPNGKIYCVPFNSTTILVIDPATNTTSTFGSLSGTSKWYGGVLAPNGKIYCVPFNSTTVLCLSSSLAYTNFSSILSPYYNKL